DASCSSCGQPAYVYDDGQLKCSGTFLRGEHQCWNHVQVNRDVIRNAVIPWIVGLLQQDAELRNTFLESAWQEIECLRNGSGTEMAAAEKDLARRQEEADRLGTAIARGGGTLETLLNLLHQTEAAIVEGKARCAELRAKSANNKFPDRETLLLDRLPAVL